MRRRPINSIESNGSGRPVAPGHAVIRVLVELREGRWGLLSVHGKAAVIKLVKIWWFMRGVLQDWNAKSYTDQALRTSDDYDHQEMHQLSDAARQAAEKARHLEESRLHCGWRRRSKEACASADFARIFTCRADAGVKKAGAAPDLGIRPYFSFGSAFQERREFQQRDGSLG